MKEISCGDNDFVDVLQELMKQEDSKKKPTS
jgi:hypothetical protein